MATRTSVGFLTSIPSAFRLGAAAGVVALVMCVGAVLAYQVAYAGRIYPGVEAMGLELGGRTPEEAQALLEAHFDQYAQTPITLRQGDHRWQVTPAALGLSLDAAETVRLGYLAGRQGGVTQRIGEEVAALGDRRTVEPALSFDEARASAVLAQMNDEVQRSPANAGLVIGADGTVQVTPSRAGLALDLPKSLAGARAATLALSTADLELPTVGLPVTLSEAELEKARDRAQRVVGRPLTLTAGSRAWTLTSRELVPLLSVANRGSSVEVRVDEAGLTAYLERLAKGIQRPATDARLKLTGRKVEIVPGTDGEELDVASSRAMILAQIGEVTTIPLVVRKTTALQAAALADLKAQADAALAGPTTLKYGDRSWQLSASELAEMLVVEDGPPGKLPAIEIDSAKMTAYVNSVAKQVDRRPQDAVFRYKDGQVSVVSDSVDGLTVDVPATVAVAQGILSKPGQPVLLQVKVTKPEVASADVGQVVVKDLIMESSTSYAGAIPAKVHNIQLAASRLNGIAVPPGAIFSFNRALGPATLAAGFQIGYSIAVNSAGQMETIPSEAGGICQVATTLFHSAFWAGYPIVERNSHLYWIARYGQPPRGLKGLDATVDDAYGVDFKFRNNTPNWLVVEAGAGGGNLRFALRGVKPGWKVTVGQPKITNVVPANRELVQQPDPTMPVGQTLYVEAPEDGFDVTIDRTVSDGDRVIDQWTARAHYRPSRNVMLVGTKPVPTTPTPAPPKPTATQVPTVAGTRTPAPPPAVATPQPARTPTKTP